MPTNNERKARQGAASRKSNSFSLVKEDIETLMRDNFDNSLKDIGTFDATVLSIKQKLLVTEGGPNIRGVQKGINEPANFYEVVVRPSWFKSPAPWTFKDFSISGNTMTFGPQSRAAVDAHPIARSNSPTNLGQTALIKVGQIVVCTFGDGVDNQGRFRDIRFDLNSTGRIDEDVEKSLRSKGATNSFFGGGIQVLGDQPSDDWKALVHTAEIDEKGISQDLNTKANVSRKVRWGNQEQAPATQAAWNYLRPYLPKGTWLTSVMRDQKAQDRIARGKAKKHKYKGSFEDEDLDALYKFIKGKGEVIARRVGVGHGGKNGSAAFDLSGASLDKIAAGVTKASEKLGGHAKFAEFGRSSPPYSLIERKNNAVHVLFYIKDIKTPYDPTVFAGFTEPPEETE